MTEAQIRSTFEILEVPYDVQYHTVTEMGSLTASTDVSAAGQTGAKASLLAAITALSADSEVKVVSLVTEWDTVGTNVGMIQAGSVGDLNGVSYSWDDKRNIIKKRMQYYLPYFKFHEILAKEMNTGGGSTFNIMH